MSVPTTSPRSVDERLLQRTPMGDCIHLPVGYFLDHVLPPLPSQVDPREVVDTLKTRGNKSRRAITSQNRWRGFARNPAESLRGESHVFKYLADVVQAIVKASGVNNVDPIVHFQNNPHGGPDYYERDINSLPDAYLHLHNTVDGTVSWMDIAVPGEYKRGCSYTDKQNNVMNISWSICKLLRKDPRRRFTYGYSIENTDMRLWYCDRYRIITTAPFDFMCEHENVVHFFASLIHARPDQLGWDPSIELLRDGPHNFQYDITVTTKDGEKVIYRTLKLLSDLAVNSVIGKGTRIWKVTRLEDGRISGETAVLKDSWVDSDQPREGDTFHELQNANMPAENHQILMDALLTVESYGDVIIDSGHDAAYPDRTIQLPAAPIPKCATSDSPKWSVRKYKIHHRVVFKEVCTPLRQLRPFQYVFKILGQICIVLKVLHQAGWVHRDISSANILVDSTGRAKLIDLEYAKKIDDDSRREMRVGTAKFMSVELDRRNYRYRPSPVVSPLPKAPPSDDFSTSRTPTPTPDTIRTPTPPILTPPKERPPPEPEPPFRYNPIHDFESLWWVTTFFVFQMEAAFKSAAPLSGQSRSPRVQDQRMSAQRLSHDQDVRFLVMSNRVNAFMKHVHTLHRSIRPIGGQLETWRAKIIRAYRKAEQTRIPDATMAMQDLHEEFAKDLFRIFDMLAGKTVMTEESWITNESEAANPPQEISSKRKREDQDEHRDEPEAGEPADPARTRKKARKARPVVLVDGPAARTRARLRAKAR